LFIDAYLRICLRRPTNIMTNLLGLPVTENTCDPRIRSRGVNPGSKYSVSINIIILSEVKWEFHSVDAPFRIWDFNCISTQRTEARPPKDHSRICKLYKHHTKCEFAVPYSRFNSQELYVIQTMNRLTTYLKQKYIIKQHTFIHK
jgi:hypothetical protein